MTSYVSSGGSIGGVFTSDTVSAVELRVISNLLQGQNPSGNGQDELRVLRNDQAFELGIAPPVVPGN